MLSNSLLKSSARTESLVSSDNFFQSGQSGTVISSPAHKNTGPLCTSLALQVRSGAPGVLVRIRSQLCRFSWRDSFGFCLAVSAVAKLSVS